MLVAIAAAGAAFLAFGPRFAPANAGEAIYAKPFSLVNQDGAPFTQADFLGRPSAFFYGFSHCPDVCPTALAEMSAILEALGRGKPAPITPARTEANLEAEPEVLSPS